MESQSSITQEQIVSFQQRVKEVTGWLLLRDEKQLENSYIKKWHKAALDCAGDIRRFTDIGVS